MIDAKDRPDDAARDTKTIGEHRGRQLFETVDTRAGHRDLGDSCLISGGIREPHSALSSFEDVNENEFLPCPSIVTLVESVVPMGPVKSPGRGGVLPLSAGS